MTNTATPGWFARHELILFWRDWLSIMSAGRRTREWMIKLFMVIFIAGLHGLAYVVEAPIFSAGATGGQPDKAMLVMLSGTMALSFFMMMSQSLESVTRAFYARADLDLILSSPAPARHVFAIRIGAIVLTSAGMATMLAAPFINVAAWLDVVRWLAAYPVLLASSAIATALSIIVVIALLRHVGPGRTRLVSQIVAAIVGAGFLIGIQVVAIMSWGSMSRISVFGSQAVIDAMPDPSSLLWLPALALTGKIWPLVLVVLASLVLLVLVIHLVAPGFAKYAVANADVPDHEARKVQTGCPFRPRSLAAALRAKEWMLLRRDPWLVSQTLMQILYLIPPAFMLWRSFGEGTGALVILAPVLVMAVGQLAGGLSWLAISGEDAPDLIASAPMYPSAVLRAKIEAVLAVIAVICGPILLVMALSSPWAAMMSMAGVVTASVSAIAIQMWFRSQAKRSMFRRRQVSSKAATFAEAFASICWAGATSLAVGASWLALIFVVLALLVLLFAWLISPPGAV